jgi:regulator of RNase E activity RraA
VTIKDLISQLQDFDTPTICNALEMIDPERKNFGYTDQSLFCLYPHMPSIVGIAKTASIRSLRPSILNADELKHERVKYYTYIHEGDLPKIVVMQDLDGLRHGHGVFWGEFNSRVHKFLGCSGVITDGSVRDIPNLPKDFQVLASAAMPSHANIHIVDYGKQVNIYSMVVNSGDIVHADLHGAVTFDVMLAERVIECAYEFEDRERAVLDACKNPDGLTFEKLIELYLSR